MKLISFAKVTKSLVSIHAFQYGGDGETTACSFLSQAASSAPLSVAFRPLAARKSTGLSSLTLVPQGVRLSPPTSAGKKIEVLLLQYLLFFSGGDGESRTRVRKHFHRTFSERSQCFVRFASSSAH